MISVCAGFRLRSTRAVSTSNKTGMELAKIVKVLNDIAPLNLAEGWDNVGLLVEPSPPHTVKSIMLTNDLTLDVMQESIKAKADMIISYHPPIFRPMKRITSKSWKERLVVSALENRIAIFSPHTASDAVQNGVNDWLASGIAKLTEAKPIKYKVQPGQGGMLCLSSVAETALPSLLDHFGNDIKVVGKSDSGTMAVWKGNYNISEELHKLGLISNDIMHFPNSEQTKFDAGAGRFCTLTDPVTLKDMVENLKCHLQLSHLRLALGLGKSLMNNVSTVALCAGSGSSVLSGCEADVYITGEMSHHDVLDATQNGISVILCEHSNSERGYLSYLKTTMESFLSSKGVNVFISDLDKDPLEVI